MLFKGDVEPAWICGFDQVTEHLVAAEAHLVNEGPDLSLIRRVLPRDSFLD